MNDEGTYLYCIIRSSEARDFGPLGVGGSGDHVTTISFDDLSGVVSNAQTRRYAATRENTMAHEKAIEKVMSEGHTALPVRFGTVAGSVQEVQGIRGFGARYGQQGGVGSEGALAGHGESVR